MEILHRRRGATVEAIRAELPDAPSPSSVRKLLEIMIERRLLTREYDGPRFVYFPPQAERRQRSALKQLVRLSSTTARFRGRGARHGRRADFDDERLVDGAASARA